MADDESLTTERVNEFLVNNRESIKLLRGEEAKEMHASLYDLRERVIHDFDNKEGMAVRDAIVTLSNTILVPNEGNLPDEVWMQILSEIPGKEEKSGLRDVRGVSKKFKGMAEEARENWLKDNEQPIVNYGYKTFAQVKDFIIKKNPAALNLTGLKLTADELRELFSLCGNVRSLTVDLSSADTAAMTAFSGLTRLTSLSIIKRDLHFRLNLTRFTNLEHLMVFEADKGPVFFPVVCPNLKSVSISGNEHGVDLSAYPHLRSVHILGPGNVHFPAIADELREVEIYTERPVVLPGAAPLLERVNIRSSGRGINVSQVVWPDEAPKLNDKRFNGRKL